MVKKLQHRSIGQNMSHDSDLSLEKLNSQRINSLDSDIKDIRRDLSTLMRELPSIIQGAVTQAVASDDKSHPSSNSSSNSILAVFITIILALGTVFGQQIYFNNTQNDKTKSELKTHVERAYDKDTELAVLQNEVKWIKFNQGIEESSNGLKKVE